MLRAQIADLSRSSTVAGLEQESLKLRLQKENAELQARIAELSKSPETVRLEQETIRLRFENETSELRARLAERTQPWWRKSGSVATVAAIIAAVLPVTTAVQGYVQKSRELALEEKKHEQGMAMEKAKQEAAIAMERERQTEELRTAYLERLKAPGEHLRTLRFILATTQDENLKAWALSEKKVVEEKLKTLQEESDRREADIAAIRKAYVEALGKADTRRADLEKLNGDLVRLFGEYSRGQEERDRAGGNHDSEHPADLSSLGRKSSGRP